MPIANGRYKIISKSSMMPLENEGGKTANGTKIVQNNDAWSANQLWTITSVPNLADTYVIRSTADWKQIFNVAGASTDDGAAIILYQESNAPNERWQFVDQGNGYFKIVAVHSKKNLNVPGASSAAGVGMIQYQDAGGADNELWQLVKC